MIRITNDETTHACRDWIIKQSEDVTPTDLPLVDVDGEIFMGIRAVSLDVFAERQWRGTLCNIAAVVEFLTDLKTAKIVKRLRK